MGEERKPLRPRPTREATENDCSFALKLLAWYDTAIARGYPLAELPQLVEDERQAILASWAPVLCIAYNLGLIPLPVRKHPRAPAANGSTNPTGTDEPSCTAGSPPASPSAAASGQRRASKRGKGKTS